MLTFLCRLLSLALLGAGCMQAPAPQPPPVPSILAPTEALHEGQSLELTGWVSDTEDPPENLVASWTLDGLPACPATAPEADGSVTCRITLPAGLVEVNLHVRNSAQQTAKARLRLPVIPSQPPAAAILHPVDGTAHPGEDPFFLVAEVKDPKESAEQLLIRWSSDLDGPLLVAGRPDAHGRVQGYAWLSPGRHLLTVQVENRSGKVGFAQVQVEVVPPNTPPSCVIVAPPEQAEPHQDAHLAAHIGDAVQAPSTLTVRWSSDRDGILAEPTADDDGHVSLPLAGLSPGVHRIELDVRDEADEACTDHVDLEVLANGFRKTAPSQPASEAALQRE